MLFLDYVLNNRKYICFSEVHIEIICQFWKAAEINLRSAGNRLEDSLLLVCRTDNHGSQPGDEKVQKEKYLKARRENTRVGDSRQRYTLAGEARPSRSLHPMAWPMQRWVSEFLIES